MVDLGRLDAMIKRPECDLCSLVVLGCKQTWQGTGTWEEALEETDTKCFINALELDRQQVGGYALQISETHSKKPFQWVQFEIVYYSEGLKDVSRERAFEICPKVDFGVLRSMLRDCVESHQSHDDLIPVTRNSPILVINVQEMRVTVAPPICMYVALSYVWGKPSESWLTLTRANSAILGQLGSLKNANIPQIIRDAIQVCLELGETYLWVDSLCIVQDDPVNQKRQIDLMNFI